MRKMLFRLFSTMVFASLVAFANTAAAETLPSKEIKDLQIALATLDYNVGYFDGVYGKKSEKALKNYLEKSGITWNGELDKKTLSRVIADAKKAEKQFAFNSYDNFSGKSLKPYELTHQWKDGNGRLVPGVIELGIANSAGNKPYTFHDETNGNTYLKVTALLGYNVQTEGNACKTGCTFDWERDDRQDKFELRLNTNKARNNAIWWGFRVQKPSDFQDLATNFEYPVTITFTQMKHQPMGKVTSLNYVAPRKGNISGKRGENYNTYGIGSVQGKFRVNSPLGNKPYSIDQYEQGLAGINSPSWKWSKVVQLDQPTNLPYTIYQISRGPYIPKERSGDLGKIKPFFEKNIWRTYKLGMFSSKDVDGWIKIYQDDVLIFQYSGPVYKDTSKPYEKAQIAIGLYRGFHPDHPLQQALMFDDFIATGNKNVLDGYLGVKRSAPNN